MAFNEQLVLYNYEREFCKRILPVLRDLGAKRLGNIWRVGREAAQPHEWRVGEKKGSSDWRKKTTLYFDGFTYTDEHRTNETTTVQDLGERRVAWSQEVRCGRRHPVESPKAPSPLSEEDWEEKSLDASFEVTNRTTVRAEAKVSAGPASRQRVGGERNHHERQVGVRHGQRRAQRVLGEPRVRGRVPRSRWQAARRQQNDRQAAHHR